MIHFNNNYALRLACKNGHFAIVKYLVKKGADIYADNNDAIIQALDNNHQNIVDYLVKNGAEMC